MFQVRQVAVCVVVWMGLAPLLCAADPATGFETHVRPLLAKNCWGCHRQTALGGLRLDSRAAMLKGGVSGAAVVPKNAAGSLLIQAVTHQHARLKMPPSGQLSESEIATLRGWIDAGAYWPDEAPLPAAKAASGEYQITPEQRAYWAFQPVKMPAIPDVKRPGWDKNPIDALILGALEAKGLKPSARASRRTLIRRATFDLTGLPPTPQQVAEFENDRSPDAFAKVVERLLASPHYGERWGRYWLDVARYSDDSLSPTAASANYPSAHRYRNWVIDAFNRDMPYDTFVRSQIAGDLLGSNDPTQYAAGLGFYALSPEMQDDRVDVTTRGFLGLTVACAQCHDHKFDPIPTKDFYSLQGVFASTQDHELPLAPKDVVGVWEAQDKGIKKQQKVLDEFYTAQREQLARMMASRTARYLLASAGAEPSDGLDGATVDRWRKYLAEPRKEHPFLEAWLKRNDAGEMRSVAQEFQRIVLSVLDEYSEIEEKNRITLAQNGNRAATTAMASLPRDKFMLWRDLFSKSVTDAGDFFRTPDGVFYYPNDQVDRFLQGDWKVYAAEQKQLLKELKAKAPAKYPFLQTIRDKDAPADIRIQIRGDRNNPGDVAPRRFLAILSRDERKPFTQGSGRLQLAEAIADANNPLTARVMVNRIWQHHFGRGIVPTPSNFGLNGQRPSHPALLDYLAAEFVRNGWSIKKLHRQIMLSETYQLGAAAGPEVAAKDPENILLSHANRQRLDVEAMRDSVLFVSGMLDSAPGEQAQRLDEKNRKRTVYGFVSRRRVDSVLALFDFPNPNSTSEGRLSTNVPLQRLFFMNSAFIDDAAQALAKGTAGPPDGQVRHLYRTLFSRLPDSGELRLGVEHIAKEGAGSYARVLLSTNEFNYVD